MEDLKTPLPIHKAAFPRIGGQLDMPASAIEKLRRAFQSAERRGLPRRDIDASVGSVLGEVDWRWPWFEATRPVILATGVIPLDWQQEGIPLTAEWDRIPHNKKVRLLTSAMCSALYVERELTQRRSHTAAWPVWRLELLVGDERCAASRALQRTYAPAISDGDLRHLPPFFAGDTCHLSIKVITR